MDELIKSIGGMAEANAHVPMLSRTHSQHCSDPTKLIPNHSAPSEASGIDLCRWVHHAVRDHKSLSMEVGFGRTIAV
uniref:Uncharacterized protein n=1 Tax=Daucus carota subsp. sativus TaxID=79200 RepID=A0A162A803_DAUCS